MNSGRNVLGFVVAAAVLALLAWFAVDGYLNADPSAPNDGVTPPASQPAP